MWECAINGCGSTFEDPEELLAHQTNGHASIRCQICGESIPEGYFGLRHVLGEHSRAEFVRAYSADAAGVSHRESVLSAIEEAVDVETVRASLEHSEEQA